jgi:ATP phosphoribosyltransferase regulatory subunit
MELAEIEGRDVSSFLKLISAKNIPGVRVFCEKKNIPADLADKICSLAEMYLPIGKALEQIKDLVSGEKMQKAYDELYRISEAMELYGIADKLYLDISVINDMNYYDGVIFNGFIKDIPESVLSGGRYDRLLSRPGKKVGAIGFAVYLDKLERFGSDEVKYDVDVMLTYGEGVEVKDIVGVVEALNKEGKSVRASATADANIRYRQRMHLEKKATGIEVIEKYD